VGYYKISRKSGARMNLKCLLNKHEWQILYREIKEPQYPVRTYKVRLFKVCKCCGKKAIENIREDIIISRKMVYQN